MTKKRTGKGSDERPLNWPDEAENITAADIDFEALAHVLANTCRRGGCTRHYHSVAAHAVIVSEEIEALDGLGNEDRRTLALHALVANAPSAWLRGHLPDSQRAADRAGRLATGIETAVREAAGLDAVLEEEHAELLRFVTRMAAAAERRDLLDDAGPGEPAGAGVAFPPLKRRIRSIPPDKAATGWLARFRALAGPDEERQRRIAAAARPDGSDPGCRAKADMDRRGSPGSLSGSIWPVMVSAVLLSGAVAAAVAAATIRYGIEPPPRIAGVRLAEITAAYTTRAASQGESAEDVRAWGEALEAALDRVAPNVIAWCCCRPAPWPPARPTRRRVSRRRSRRSSRSGVRRDERAGTAIRAEVRPFAPPPYRPRGHGRVGGRLAGRGLARACQCELVGRSLGLRRLPAVRRGPGDRRPGAVRAAGGGRFPGSLPEDRARRAGHGGCGRTDGTVFLDGEPVGRAKTHALDGRPLAAIAPGIIPPGHFYVHGDHIDSHDSRYAEIGLVPRGRIHGRAVAMPDIPWLGLDGPLVGPEDRMSRSCAVQRRAGPAGSGGRDRPRLPETGRDPPTSCRRPLRGRRQWRLALALAAPASAKDLGVRGATWPVAEPDLLAQIEARLVEMERSGELARLEQDARANARPEAGGTGPGARHCAGHGRTQPPLGPRHHGRAGHPHGRRRAHRRCRNAGEPAGARDARPRPAVRGRQARGGDRLGAGA